MDDTRWQQIDKLFGEALVLDEGRREAFLKETCGDDGKLRQAVERLLALETEARSFLAEPAGVVEPHEPEPSSALDGLRIGPYRVLRPIGHGGMGSVYLARREDDYRQEVAIKLVRHRGFLGKEVRRRFRRERQVLARLEHPNVARLYDGGTSDGIPYLVMEYVEGLPIDRYCDRHRLTIRRRLELFREVCSAVSHAHRRLLVHCDLKPSNILVTADGTAKLLDFGIAKLLRSDDPDEATLTRGLRPLTPGYASPEQVLGDAVTTASDVYSLGVVLYKLLCGYLLYPTPGERGAEIGSAIFERDAEKPSRRVLRRRSKDEGDADPEAISQRRRLTPRELSRRIRGDLDAIVLKALRKVPDERYDSVDELSRDVGRHLEAVPVRARRGTWRYRTARFLRRAFLPPDPRRRRERLLWASLLAVILTVSWATPSLRGPSVSCDGALEELAGVWDARGRMAIRDAFLATGLAFADDVWRRIERSLGDYADTWVAMRTEICEATYVHGEQSKRMLDATTICLDDRRQELQAVSRLFADADAAVVREAPKAVAELRPLVVCADRRELSNLELPPNDPSLSQQIDNVRTVAEDQLARYNTKRPVDFEALRQAVETARGLSYRPVLARALFVLGAAESYEGGNPQAGVKHLEEALLAAMAGGDRRLQTRIYAELGRVEIRRSGNTESARRRIDYAEAAFDALGPGNDDLQYEVASAAAMLAFETGKWVEAKANYERALNIAEKGLDPAQLIQALTNVGMFDSTRYLERAIDLNDREFGRQNVNISRALHNLAVLHGYQGHYDKALPLVLRTLELLEVTYGDQHPDMGYPLVLAGQILSAQGRPSEALPHLQRARPLLEASLGGEAPLLGDLRHALADAQRWLGRYDEALDHARAADRIYAATRLPAHQSRRVLLATLGSLQREQGDLPAALTHHGQLLEMIRDQHVNPWEEATLLLEIAETFLEAGGRDEARELLEKALARDREAPDPLKTTRIRFAQARATWQESPARSRRLAEEAAAELGDDPPLQKQLKERIHTWLHVGEEPRL